MSINKVCVKKDWQKNFKKLASQKLPALFSSQSPPSSLKQTPSTLLENSYKPQKSTNRETTFVKNKASFKHCMTLWQLGDWESLALLDVDNSELANQPYLTLLAAIGQLQIGNIGIARQYLFLALDRGCSKQQILQVLLSSAYNNLGYIAVLQNKKNQAIKYFKSAILIDTLDDAQTALVQTRISQQLLKLQDKKSLSDTGEFLEQVWKAWCIGDWEALKNYDTARLSIEQNRKYIILLIAASYQQLGDEKALEQSIELALLWGCEPQEIEQLLFAGAHNLFARICILEQQYDKAIFHFTMSININFILPLPIDCLQQRIEKQISEMKIKNDKSTVSAMMAKLEIK